MATTPYSTTVIDSDQSHYRGALPSITLETWTDNREDDLEALSQILKLTAFFDYTRRYVVTNTGPFDLTGIRVTDTHGDLSINCHGVTTLAPGASLACEATFNADCGPQLKTSTVTASTQDGYAVSDTDPNNYWGSLPGICG